jgi:hypothetical protein
LRRGTGWRGTAVSHQQTSARTYSLKDYSIDLLLYLDFPQLFLFYASSLKNMFGLGRISVFSTLEVLGVEAQTNIENCDYYSYEFGFI